MREKILDEHSGWTDQQPPEREVADPGRRRLLRAALFGGAGLGLAGGGVAAILNSKPASRTFSLAAPAATRGGSIGAPVSTRPSGMPGVSASATASTHPSISAAPVNSLSPTTSASAHQTTGSGITYPGLLHTQADFDRMAAKVRVGAQPWQAGWDRLVANPHSQSTWKPRATATVVRGGAGENYALLYNDIHAAYQNALRWRIRGDTAHADAARDILKAWSVTLTAERPCRTEHRGIRRAGPGRGRRRRLWRRQRRFRPAGLRHPGLHALNSRVARGDRTLGLPRIVRNDLSYTVLVLLVLAPAGDVQAQVAG